LSIIFSFQIGTEIGHSIVTKYLLSLKLIIIQKFSCSVLQLYKLDTSLISRLKYTFCPYFCCFYSIWSLFSFCVQLGPHFRQILVNLVIFTNGV